jgi:hypothetical protein
VERRERRIRRLFVYAFSLLGAHAAILLLMVAAGGWFLLLSIEELGAGQQSISTASVCAIALFLAAYWSSRRLSAAAEKLHLTIRRELNAWRRETDR